MKAQTPRSEVLGQLPGPAETDSAFIALQQQLHPWADRKLGYFGDARFVCFYYEPRGQEVMWNDGRSYGFATGAWCYFSEHIVPLADRYKAGLGHSGAIARDVLLIDRMDHIAWFAERAAAKQFLAGQRELAIA